MEPAVAEDFNTMVPDEPLFKAVEHEGLGVFCGWAIVCTKGGEQYFDLHGDHIPDEAMAKAALDYSLAGRDGKIMHDGEVVGDLVWLWPETRKMADAFGIQTEVTGLRVGYKPRDERTAKLFRDGKIRGFSIGGSYGKVEELPDD
jgi:hypothetical protein